MATTKTGWIIKATYLTGPHKGKTYYLRKGGYVIDDGRTWPEWAYKTKGFASRECKKLKEWYDLSYRIERQDKANKPAETFIYELQSFEPHKVELITEFG